MDIKVSDVTFCDVVLIGDDFITDEFISKFKDICSMNDISVLTKKYDDDFDGIFAKKIFLSITDKHVDKDVLARIIEYAVLYNDVYVIDENSRLSADDSSSFSVIMQKYNSYVGTEQDALDVLSNSFLNSSPSLKYIETLESLFEQHNTYKNDTIAMCGVKNKLAKLALENDHYKKYCKALQDEISLEIFNRNLRS